MPDVILGGNGACFAVFIANTYSEPIVIGVEYDGKPLYTQNFSFIPSGTGAAHHVQAAHGRLHPARRGGHPLPQSRGRRASHARGSTSIVPPGSRRPSPTWTPRSTAPASASAFHITTSAAVAAYDIYPYGGGQSALTSATLLLPSTSWDTNYIAVDAYGTGLGTRRRRADRRPAGRHAGHHQPDQRHRRRRPGSPPRRRAARRSTP